MVLADSLRQYQRGLSNSRKQCWQGHSQRGWGTVAQARRGGALEELKELQKVEVETAPVGKVT